VYNNSPLRYPEATCVPHRKCRESSVKTYRHAERYCRSEGATTPASTRALGYLGVAILFRRRSREVSGVPVHRLTTSDCCHRQSYHSVALLEAAATEIIPRVALHVSHKFYLPINQDILSRSCNSTLGFADTFS
jgi:hypothetical protein